MSMKIFNLIFFFLVALLPVKNRIIINKNLDVNKTEIKFGKEDDNTETYCMDVISNDTITIYAGKKGLSGYTFKLQIIQDAKDLKIIRWTDYPAYDGKSSFNLPLKSYKVELNKNSYQPGDTLKAAFLIKAGQHKFQHEKIKIEGEIHHIIGGNYYKWHGGKSEYQKYWKNGKTTYGSGDN